jgi:hypothetical protein
MSILHGRWRRQVSLLVLGALEGAEEAATREHLRGCERCESEREALEAALDVLAQDPLREAEPPLPASVLAARVFATVDARAGRRAEPRIRWAWGSPRWALGAAVAVGLAIAALLPRTPVPSPTPLSQEMVVSEETVRRMERGMAREHAARYLAEAQDVLVTVTANPADCDREEERLDVAQEARRSRELLARRALVVDLEGEAVASARPVLEDVEQLLREVAALPACVRAGQVQAIHREMTRRHLLMKIDLMTQELQG